MSTDVLGTLVVVVLKARNLTDKHSFRKQDPYTVIRLSRTELRTKTDQRGGQHPVWDEELHLPVQKKSSKENRTLEVSCFSEESRNRKELVGTGQVDITDTLRTGEFDEWVKIEENGAYRGEIYLEMTFFAAGPAPLARRPTKLPAAERLSRPSESAQGSGVHQMLSPTHGSPHANHASLAFSNGGGSGSSVHPPRPNSAYLSPQAPLPPEPVPSVLRPSHSRSSSTGPASQASSLGSQAYSPVPHASTPVPHASTPGPQAQQVPLILRPGRSVSESGGSPGPGRYDIPPPVPPRDTFPTYAPLGPSPYDRQSFSPVSYVSPSSFDVASPIPMAPSYHAAPQNATPYAPSPYASAPYATSSYTSSPYSSSSPRIPTPSTFQHDAAPPLPPLPPREALPDPYERANAEEERQRAALARASQEAADEELARVLSQNEGVDVAARLRAEEEDEEMARRLERELNGESGAGGGPGGSHRE